MKHSVYVCRGHWTQSGPAEGNSWRFQTKCVGSLKWDESNLTPLEMPWQRPRATRLAFILQEFGQRKKAASFVLLHLLLLYKYVHMVVLACNWFMKKKIKERTKSPRFMFLPSRLIPLKAHTQKNKYSTIEIIKRKRLQFLGSGSRSAITN